MSDRFNNRGRKPSSNDKNIPKRTTADNFQLDLREEDLTTNTDAMPQRHRDLTTADYYAGKQVYYTEKERKKQEKEHRKRNRIKSGKNKRTFALVWLAMVLLISFTLASFLITGSNDLLAVNRVDDIVDISLPEDVTSEQLAKILAENGVINSEMFFTLYCQVTAEDKLQYIKPGVYSIKTDLDYEAIVNTLRSGNTDRAVVEITFPEGVNALDIAELFEEYGISTAEEALEAMNETLYGSYSVIQDIKNESLRYYTLEGYMFPDTYQFYQDDGAEAAIKKMISNCENKLALVMDPIQQSGMTIDEVLILASIIQREVANVEDMERVSAVLHNRLAQEEGDLNKLECDSTIFYPYHTRLDLPTGMEDYVSDYNTYDIVGLPVGAICNPGMDAIKAAIQPSAEYSEYYYFCHAEDGTTYYGRTAEEHEQNLVLAGLRTGTETEVTEEEIGE